MNFSINNEAFVKFPQLESNRLKLREFNTDDKNAMYTIRSDSRVMKYMGREEMDSVSQAEEFIIKIIDSFREGKGINWCLIEKETESFVGYFGIWRIDHSNCRGEIGFALHPDFWGKGYMLEAAEVILDFGFEVLKLHSVEANIDPENVKSVSLVEKSGFTREAYFRENFLFREEFRDSVIYSLLSSDKR